MATHYRLAISDYQGLASWSWSLFDSGGAFIMGHQVRLDTAAQEYEAIRDLQGHVTENGGTAHEALLALAFHEA